MPVCGTCKNMNNNVEVKIVEGLGRCAFSLKDFEPGDVIIDEPPLVVFTSLPDLWEKIKCNIPVKEAVMDMARPLLGDEKPNAYNKEHISGDMVNDIPEVEKMARELHVKDKVELMQLHLIVRTNAHSYTGKRVYARDAESSKHALFALGSKVAHSCAPNTEYTSKTKDGHGKYTAVKHIKAGCMLTWTYIGYEALMFCSTPERQRRLLKVKNFFCQCDRCVTLDQGRAMKCPLCLKGNCLPEIQSFEDVQRNEIEHWKCLDCGVLPIEHENHPAEIEECVSVQLDRTQNTIKWEPQLVLMYPMKEMCTKVLGKLFPHNPLAAKMLHMNVKIINTITTCFRSSSKTKKNLENDLQIMTRNLVKSVELNAAFAHHNIMATDDNYDTDNVLKDLSSPPPCFAITDEVFFTAMDMSKMDPASRHAEMLCVIEKYLPYMRIVYGNDDNDIQKRIVPMLEYEAGIEKCTSRGCRAGHGKGKGKSKSKNKKK